MAHSGGIRLCDRVKDLAAFVMGQHATCVAKGLYKCRPFRIRDLGYVTDREETAIYEWWGLSVHFSLDKADDWCHLRMYGILVLC